MVGTATQCSSRFRYTPRFRVRARTARTAAASVGVPMLMTVLPARASLALLVMATMPAAAAATLLLLVCLGCFPFLCMQRGVNRPFVAAAAAAPLCLPPPR